MSITDLLPWKRKKKTKVPVKAREQPVRLSDRERERPPDAFSRWLGLAPFGAFGGWWGVFGPRMDMVENDEGFRITMEVPGLSREDVDVTLFEDRLILRGEKREEEKHQGRSSYRLRRSEQAFRRSIDLPCEIEADEVEASLRNGVLTVSLPKADHARRRRQIPIRRR